MATKIKMTHEIDVLIEDPRWDDFDLEALCARHFDGLMAQLGHAALPYEVSVLACNDARIAELNKEFRAKSTPTNVLSWPAVERAPEVAGGTPDAPYADMGMCEMGDIAISYETCVAEAQAANRRVMDHVIHLLCHGFLHLLGYDHETDADADLMERYEIAYLGSIGIGNPYECV